MCVCVCVFEWRNGARKCTNLIPIPYAHYLTLCPDLDEDISQLCKHTVLTILNENEKLKPKFMYSLLLGSFRYDSPCRAEVSLSAKKVMKTLKILFSFPTITSMITRSASVRVRMSGSTWTRYWCTAAQQTSHPYAFSGLDPYATGTVYHDR